MEDLYLPDIDEQTIAEDFAHTRWSFAVVTNTGDGPSNSIGVLLGEGAVSKTAEIGSTPVPDAKYCPSCVFGDGDHATWCPVGLYEQSIRRAIDGSFFPTAAKLTSR